MKDGWIPSHTGFKWSVSADVEAVAWDPHIEHSFLVSLEDGTVEGFDIQAVKSDQSYDSKTSFTLHAHDKAVCTVSYNPLAPNVKLWDLSNNQPSCVASNNGLLHKNTQLWIGWAILTKKMIFTYQIQMMFFTFIKQDQMDQLFFVCMEVVILGKVKVVAMDLRGHGKSSTENELDLSIETVCNDVIAVVKPIVAFETACYNGGYSVDDFMECIQG
ncbi:hypothetical protein ACSBR1_032775 [Camellia fascicularis]